MRKTILCALLITPLIAIQARASGAMHLVGTIKSFDSETLVIKSGKELWKLNRNQLEKTSGKPATALKANKGFDEWISFDSVRSVDAVTK